MAQPALWFGVVMRHRWALIVALVVLASIANWIFGIQGRADERVGTQSLLEGSSLKTSEEITSQSQAMSSADRPPRSTSCNGVEHIVGEVLFAMVAGLNVTDVRAIDVSSVVAEADVVTKSGTCFEATIRLMTKVIVFRSVEQSAGWRALQEGLTLAAGRLSTTVDGEKFPTESSQRSCLTMMALAALSSAQHPRFVAVEHGTFMGYSTKCIAAGTQIHKKIPFFAFDAFDYMPVNKDTWVNSDMAKKRVWLQNRDNYKAQVQKNILPWSATLIEGFIGSGRGERGAPSDYGNNGVSFYAMDASKDLPFFISALNLVSPSFVPGSILVLGDSLLVPCTQIGSVLSELDPSHLKFLFHSIDTTHTFWLVHKAFNLRPGGAKHLASSVIDDFRESCRDAALDLYGLRPDVRTQEKLRHLGGCITHVHAE